MKFNMSAYFYIGVSYFFFFMEDMRCLAEMKPVRFSGEMMFCGCLIDDSCCCCCVDYFY